MIKNLEIENFKSIKQLKLDCKRINVVIGEPNTGKSTILETFGILSFGGRGKRIKDFVRFESMSNLFYDENLEESITLKTDDIFLEITFDEGKFKGRCHEEESEVFSFDSNSDSVLLFEEPESHAFPYYTNFLAERIALAKTNNQYFISTHNPYLLLSILEKAHKDDIAIFITYFEDDQTKVKRMSEKELEELMELEVDLFFNIERFLDVQE